MGKLPVITGAVLIFAPTALLYGRQVAVPPRVDHYGDPLPAHASARLGTIRLRQAAAISRLVFSRDGKTLAAGDYHSIRLWDVHSRALLSEYPIPPRLQPLSGRQYDYGLGALTFSEQNRLLAAVNRKGRVSLYDLLTGKKIRQLSAKNIYPVALAPDGKVVACCEINHTGLTLWDLVTDKKIRELHPSEELFGGTAFSPDGKIVATAATSEKEDWVYLWEVSTGKRVGQILLHTGSARSIAFSPDGKMLAVTYEVSFRYFDKPAPKIDHTAAVFDLAKGKEIRIFLKDGPEVAEIAFSPDGKTVAVSGRGAIVLLDANTGQERPGPSGHLGSVGVITFSAGGKTLISIGGDSTIRLWDVNDGTELGKFKIPEHTFYPGAALSRDGKLAAIITDETINLWDTDRAKEIWQCKEKGGSGSFALSADGKLLAKVDSEQTNSDTATVQVWHTTTRRQLYSWRTPSPSAIQFSPDGKLVAITESPYTGDRLHLFSLPAGIELRNWQTKSPSIGELAFSPDGKVLASSHSDQTIRLWETGTGKYLGWLAKHPGGTDNLFATCPIVFSPDSKLLASGGYDNTVRVWDTVTAKEVLRFTGHEAAVYALAFSPDGRRLASGSGDTTTLIWDVYGALSRPPK
jgi:WD40 repeat protein